jgi:hypothetical protein
MYFCFCRGGAEKLDDLGGHIGKVQGHAQTRVRLTQFLHNEQVLLDTHAAADLLGIIQSDKAELGGFPESLSGKAVLQFVRLVGLREELALGKLRPLRINLLSNANTPSILPHSKDA